MLTTFFDGEIISKKYPFLTRKWDADEDVDRKHWVSANTKIYIHKQCADVAPTNTNLIVLISIDQGERSHFCLGWFWDTLLSKYLLRLHIP